MKKQITPSAAAAPIHGKTKPTRSPSPPAALRTPSVVSHDSGTSARAMFVRTFSYRMKSAVAEKTRAAAAKTLTMM
jgi:hypothetical protein